MVRALRWSGDSVQLDKISTSMLRARSLSLGFLLAFCMSSKWNWVLERSRSKISFPRSNWFTLVVSWVKRSCCRSSLLEHPFNCSFGRSIFFAFRTRSKHSRCSADSVMHRTVEVKSRVAMVLTSMTSGSIRCVTGDTNYILDRIGIHSQLDHWFMKPRVLNSKRRLSIDGRVNHNSIGRRSKGWQGLDGMDLSIIHTVSHSQTETWRWEPGIASDTYNKRKLDEVLCKTRKKRGQQQFLTQKRCWKKPPEITQKHNEYVHKE